MPPLTTEKVLDVGDNASMLDDILEPVLEPKDSLLPYVTHVVHSVVFNAERPVVESVPFARFPIRTISGVFGIN